MWAENCLTDCKHVVVIESFYSVKDLSLVAYTVGTGTNQISYIILRL